jgi:hypothetical protein
MAMRRLLAAALFLAIPGSAWAEWIEYKNPAEAFMVNFPSDPRVENITYTTESGITVPARKFSADEGAGRFSVIVVDTTKAEKDELNAMAHEASRMRPKGTVKFDYLSELDGIHGHQLSMIMPNGDQYQVQLFMYHQEHKLYIAEGTVPANARPPALFWTSLAMIHADGSVVNLVREGKAQRLDVQALPNRP